MSLMEDMPQLMHERYSLMMRRERWRGICDGATLCNTVLMAANLICAATGIATMSWWHIAVCPTISLLGMWRWDRLVKRIEAIDGGMRETVALAPQPKSKESMVN
jgi:hypothetical protein